MEINKWHAEQFGIELATKYANYAEKANKARNELFDAGVANLNQLWKQLNEKLGLDLQYKTEIKWDGHERQNVIDFESDNIADKNPVIAMAWHDFRICNFSCGKARWKAQGLEGKKEKYYGGYELPDIDYDKPAELWFVLDLHFSYKHNDGGSNGAKIGTAYYESGNWNVIWSADNKR